MKPNRLFFGMALLLGTMVLPASAQVSNDNEDGVYKTDSRMMSDFVPGQVIVKFKDASTIQVRRNAKGKFQAASLNPVDKLLREYGVADMEKLFPKEVAKPAAKLRKKVAPNGTIVKERNLDKIFLVKTSVQMPDSIFQLIDKLKEMDDVEYAEPNYYAYITAEVPYPSGSMPSQQKAVRRVPVNVETEASVICANPSQNPLFSEQYAIAQQNIQALWDKPIINKKRPVIAILDTGVDITHPDLVDNIWTNTKENEGETAYDDDSNGIVDDIHGWNFVDNYYDLTDRNSHGTHVAGIAAAANNGIGIVGANPLALIMPVKVISDQGRGDVATIARGIIYAAENGADVINMSFGGSTLSGTEKDALDRAYQTAVLVASAGNNGTDIYDHNPQNPGTNYPAAYYLVLGVEASGSNLQRASFSNYDPDGPIYSEDGTDGRNYEVQVAGVDILSTLPNGNYGKLSGTSMSAPLFAGAVSALQMVKDYPSKDVLFGDLIHLNADFAQIYSDDTPRTPKIDLVSLQVDDNVAGNNNIDGQVDVGETIKFTPVLRNTWADVTDINLSLSVDDAYSNFVEIVNPEVSFGWSLSAYGRAEAKTPIQVRFADNIGNNTRVKFAFSVNCPESNQTFTNDVYVTVNNMVKLSGMITENRTLTANQEYLVSDNLGIPQGVTLTIEPGTVLRFNSGVGISNSGTLIADGTPEKPIIMIPNDESERWNGLINATLRYCKLSYAGNGSISGQSIKYENCVLSHCAYTNLLGSGQFYYVNIIDSNSSTYFTGGGTNVYFSNIINSSCNNYVISGLEVIPNLPENNWINSLTGNQYIFGKSTNNVETINLPSNVYFGTSREDFLRPYIYEMGKRKTYAWYDLTNMRKEPVAEAHGMVWKVVVNGKDAQDEYEDLAPLGVARHKFEVYFNRPMNKAVAPQISFGLRKPYTQNAVNEDGSWNEEGTIYTAYKTITGRTNSDGVNRIYVYGAEDNEYFEIPYENTRFNINIQAVGSMATGFAAEAGLGKVDLTWNNEENNFEDAMGFNVYRYTEGNEANPTRINQEIVDVETTEYTDYDVTPGTTYYYMYKVLSTDLKEFDASNVVAATPLTSTKGDANGSGEVDVADVITTVNYAAGQEPKPFIFEAADMNTDQAIDILDVIGIIKVIMNPDEGAQTSALATATYTVEDGVVYVDCPVALAGVQVQLAFGSDERVSVADDLKGFETTSAWLTDNDYLFLGYSMSGKTLAPGKHALLNIGAGQIAKIRLSDSSGRNVEAIGNEATAIDRMGKDVMTVKGVYNMSGQKVAGSADKMKSLPKGVYIINGEKVVK